MSTDLAQLPEWSNTPAEVKRLAIRYINWSAQFEKAYPGVLHFTNPVHMALGMMIFRLHVWSGGAVAVRTVNGEPAIPWVVFEKVLNCPSEVVTELEIDEYGEPTGHVYRVRGGVPYVRIDSLPTVPPLIPDYLVEGDEGKTRLELLKFMGSQILKALADTNPEVKRRLADLTEDLGVLVTEPEGPGAGH